MRITGICCSVPKNIVKPEQFYELLGEDDTNKIVQTIGVKERRCTCQATTAADLCETAAKNLLESLGWQPETVDLLVYVTQTPDFFLPGTSYVLHEKLGMSDHCLCLDISAGCSGFMHGLITCHSLLQQGRVSRALLLCGDTISRITNPRDKSTNMLFGDAGSATALEASTEDELRAVAWGSDGLGTKHLMVPGGAFRNPWHPDMLESKEDEHGNWRKPSELFMDGAQVFNFTIKRVPPMIQSVLTEADWAIEDVDAFVFHQANKFMLEFLRKKIKIPPEKMAVCLDKYGNTSSASIPLTISSELRDTLKSPATLVLAGFGVGLSWSAIGLQTKNVNVLPIVEHEK